MKTEETKSDAGQSYAKATDCKQEQEWTVDEVRQKIRDTPVYDLKLNAKLVWRFPFRRPADEIIAYIAKVREERDALDNTLTGSNELNALLQKTLATEREAREKAEQLLSECQSALVWAKEHL